MLSILCVILTIKVKVGIPESFKVGWYPPKKLGRVTLNAPGSIAFSQEHFKTISYAKFGGQTECIMGNWKIVNAPQKNIPEKPQIENGQWTNLMSEIQVFNMFKLLKVVLLCSSAARASSGETSTCC